MKTLSIMALAAGMFVASCSKTPPPEPQSNTPHGMRTTQVWNNGNIDGTMMAYYAGNLSSYHYRMFSSQTAASILAHHPMLNTIYRYEIPSSGTHPTSSFVPVLGMNTGTSPMWQESI